MSVPQSGRLAIMASTPLDQLKHTLADQGLYTPPHGLSPPSHDDATLLFVPSPLFRRHPLKYHTHSRFLHARKSDPAKAHKQFAATETWRRENKVLDLYATFDSDELESAKRFYPRWTGRRDKVSLDLWSMSFLRTTMFAYTAWNTRLHISLSITDRAPPKRAQRSSRGAPLSTHVRL